MSEQDELLCKAMLDVVSGRETVGGGELSRGNATNASEGVVERFVTSCGFSTLEGIAWRQADERVVGAGLDEEGDGMVRIPPVDELFGQEAIPKEDEILPQSVGEKFAERLFRTESTYLSGSQSSECELYCG